MDKPKLSSLIKKQEEPKPWVPPDVKSKVDPGTGPEVRIYKSNPANARAHAVIRAWLNNGQDQGKAYQSVYKKSKLSTARAAANKLFKKPEVIEAVGLYIHGTNDPEERKNKGWALKILQGWVEINILDYFDDDWKVLTPKKMKADLEQATQLAITEVQINETTRTDDDGKETINRTVRFKTTDKLRSLETMAKIERWIELKEQNINIAIGADVMIDAAQRVKRIKERTIEGELNGGQES